MANKEQKKIKRFPRRLLSSFRRGKKVNLQASKNDLQGESTETVGFTQFDLETAQNENAIIDLEATLILDSPGKTGRSETDTNGPVSPKRNLRRVLDEETHDVLGNVSTPQPQRLVLGGPMSASADSGIDCSILLSEKSSPEQFVAFTRREAERLRQEQLLNGSILETLDEVDKSSSEDTDNVTDRADIENENGVCCNQQELVEGAVGGYSEKNTTFQQNNQSDSTCDTLPLPNACGGRLGPPNHSLVEDSQESLGSFGGDYVLLAENSDVVATTLVDATRYISNNKKPGEEISQSETDNTNQSVDNINMNVIFENEPVLNNAANDQNVGEGNINRDGYLNFYANRTDEVKSAEARMRQTNSPGAVLHLEMTHDIVNPIPVMSSSIATHRVIPSTPSPARLYVNENSAFAKCKSLKRSVSDVGKGILGRLRHLSKDDTISKDEYVCGKLQNTNCKKSGFTKLKKFGVKDKQNSKVKYIEEKVKYKVRHKSEQAAQSSVDFENIQDRVNCAEIRLNKNISKKSSVMKEIVFNGEKMTSEKSTDVTVGKQSPVYKEILSKNIKHELEDSFLRQHSPVMMESIHDLTASISEMTTALCASSAESIACICDCKNRYSDPECCEKRKTPSPLMSDECVEKTVTPSRLFSDNVENSHSDFNVDALQTNVRENFESELYDSYPVSTFENEIYESSPLFYKNASANKENNVSTDLTSKSLFTMENDETSDESTDENFSSSYYHDDIENTCSSSDECSDLDCSNCCNASPNTGNVDILSSSSDSECSFTGSCENILLTHKEHKLNEKKRSESSESLRSSSQNSDSVSSSSCSDGKASPAQEDCSFTIEGSPYSVSFREIDFENGDVMYVANNLSDELENCWIDDSKDSEKLSAVCATPVSSPRVCDDLSSDSSPCPLNHSDNSFPVSSQNATFENQTLLDEKENREGSASRLVSQPNADRSLQSNDQSPLRKSSLPPSTQLSPNPLNLSQDSSFTNVSFEGSFADASFSVSGHRNASFSRNSSFISNERYSLNEQKVHHGSHPSHSQSNSVLNGSHSFNQNFSFSELNDSRYIQRFGRRHLNRSPGQLNDSRLLQSTLRRNHNQYVSLNNSRMLDNSRLQNANNNFSRLESSFMMELAEQTSSGHSLNISCTSGNPINQSVDMVDSQNTSLHVSSPLTSPLDLSVNKGIRSSHNSRVSCRSDRDWVDRHLGQVYSPAKRVLHKNRGLSESDLCKQILDLYVSDADESGFEQVDNETSLSSLSIHSTGDNDMPADLDNFTSTNLDDTGSEDEQQRLQFGTYVAPRNVVKETNVDDFTTTTVWTCYTGEAKTRKLQGNPGSLHLRGEDRRRAALIELQNLSREKKLSKKKSSEQGRADTNVKLRNQMSPRREALRDRTNTAHRLSSLEMPVSLASNVQAEGVKQEIREERQSSINMNEKSFDRLTVLHTVHNGQRKVRCLSMDESQSVVKYYPPPKEASRVSWGQTISEMDLYRHTPRKTPVKTRPILNQKENSYPYEDDTPSPIVLTKMRKPKSLAKRYKNWPWS